MASRIERPDDHGQPVEIEKRKPLTKKQRAELFAAHNGRCHICSERISQDWHDDHIKPLWAGGSNDISNRAPAHIECHKSKTHEQEAKARAKCKRLAGETNTGPRAKIRSRGFQTNRGGKWKAKIGGGVERR